MIIGINNATYELTKNASGKGSEKKFTIPIIKLIRKKYINNNYE